MNENRNPILLGQAEEIDLVRPEVRAMLESPGLYVGGDSLVPDVIVPLVSQNGRVFSMTMDTELDPERFVSTLTLHGPYLAKAPEQRPAGDGEAAYLRWRLEEIMPLFEEARDALPAITEPMRKLRGIRVDLADRMDAAGTRTREDFAALRKPVR